MKNLFIFLVNTVISINLFGVSSIPDVRVFPLLDTEWGQTTISGNACFNYYTPDSSGYPPLSPGSTSNYPAGCVATAMAQVMNYNQWARPNFPFMQKFYIKADGVQYQSPLMYGTLAGYYDWFLLSDLSSGLMARQEAGRLLHDIGSVLSMEYYSWANWGSGTDFDNVDGAFNGFSYSNAITIEGNYVSGGSLQAQSISPVLADLAITTNLDAGLPVIIGVNTQNLQNGHALVIDGYGYNALGVKYFHYNFGLPVQGVTPPATNLGWFTLPGVGLSNDSAGYDILDGIAFNLFKAVSTIPLGEIISGRITDKNGNALSGIQIDITSANPMFVPVTVYTDSMGIYASYGTIVPNQQYMVTASSLGYQTNVQVCNTGLSQKQWIDTVTPANGDGYYYNTVGNVKIDFILQPGFNIPPVLPICDFIEYAGLSQYWNTIHTQITDPEVRYDYNGDWTIDCSDLIRILNSWLIAPPEFRTEFYIPLDIQGSMPANMPWQYSGNAGAWSIAGFPMPAAESPTITNNQYTSFILPVKLFPGFSGIADIMFELECDTEPGVDVFEFLVDGVIQTSMIGQSSFSGSLSPQLLNYQIQNIASPTLLMLEWRYSKDAMNSVGMDKVWIRNINIHAHP